MDIGWESFVPSAMVAIDSINLYTAMSFRHHFQSYNFYFKFWKIHSYKYYLMDPQLHFVFHKTCLGVHLMVFF